MPNRTSEPHGKVTASATPRSMISRTSGAEDCTLVPPSSVTKFAIVASAGRIFMPLMSSGTTIFLVRMKRGRRVDESEAELDVLHLSVGVFAIPRIQPHRAALGARHQEGEFAGADDREATRLITGIDIGDVGNAVARHVVMIEGFAELLGRENLVLDGATGVLLDRGAPILQRLLQGM